MPRGAKVGRVPRFEPFAAIRYREDIDLNVVTSPPYDVIDTAERERLAASTAYNAVHVDLPSDYDEAAGLLRRWEDEGVLVSDDEPSFYVYRMGYTDEAGRARQSTGVLGALELQVPGEGDVLPHEHTTPKAKSDRLALTRATQANLSPIWGLSLASGLTGLADVPGPPVGRATDELGVHHRLWRVTAPAIVEAISELVSSAPVVIADGHHRYETSLQYRDEVGPGTPADLTLALVVELTESELAVRPIHRLLHGLAGVDVVEALSGVFEPFEAGRADETLPAQMDDAGALGLVLGDGSAWLLRPREGAFPGDLPDLDSSRLDVARQALPPHDVEYQHGTDIVLRRVAAGEADAGVLLRPATVAQIQATAHARDRMPPKTTYFYPKPRTGFVFRKLT
jgi:uncharacterized protein (DUF1015 family)